MTELPPPLAAELTARGQHGVFDRTQAADVGVTKAMMQYYTRPGGPWRRVAPRVYEVVAQPADWRRPLMAALLWGGPLAVLSHRSAAAVLGMDGVGPGTIELYVPSGRPHRTWRVHRGSPPLEAVQRTGRLQHTDAVQTLRDLAKVADDDVIERALEWVLRTKHASVSELRVDPPRRLRTVLDRRPPDAPPTGSELETRMIQLLRATAVPAPARQYPVHLPGGGSRYLDLAFPDAGLFIELDGKSSHDRPGALLYDRHRQNEIVSRLGWRPLRYTWDDVCNHPFETARHVADAYRAHAGLTSGPGAGRGPALR